MSVPDYEGIYLGRVEKSDRIKRHLNTYEGVTHLNRNPAGILLFRKAISMLELKKKKLLVNNIGMGAERMTDLKGHINTYEPYELANAALKEGTRPDIIGYTISADKAETLSKNRKIVIHKDDELFIKDSKLPEEIGKVGKENGLMAIEPHEKIVKAVRFGSMDILNSTPVRKAHVTYFMNVFPHIEQPREIKAALKNLSDSTLKGGFILTDREFDEKTLSEIRLKKVKLDMDKSDKYTKVYQKVS